MGARAQMGKRIAEIGFNAGGGVVNWFPGHMAAATRAIRDRLRLADLVIEVRDARVSHHFSLLPRHPNNSGTSCCPNNPKRRLLPSTNIPLSSANEDLQSLLSCKRRIIALNKKDMANPNIMHRWVHHFESCKQDCLSVNAHSKSSVSQEKIKHATVGPLPGVTQDIAGYKEESTLRRRKSRQEIGHRAGGPVDNRQKASNKDIGHRAKKSGVAPRRSGLWRSTADWAIGRKRGRCDEEPDEAPTNDVPGNRMLIRVVIV
ncbi:50S ribosome-binding GTPase [Musa troglodytarum]|uniref:50S ribosome-binding GTPase n=1 Tax=Musa troglodytarum TaxID=320322 RepID=A0A9E7H9V1_9LILI|nr:50S ribosome-binding GTPase [Musa troglodytarum]